VRSAPARKHCSIRRRASFGRRLSALGVRWDAQGAARQHDHATRSETNPKNKTITGSGTELAAKKKA